MSKAANDNEDDRSAVLEEFDTKLLAITEGQRKLRERLESVKVDSDEAFEIKTLLLRLDMKADSIMRDREAFDEGESSIAPPSDDDMNEMNDRVQKIRDINVKNQTARNVVALVVQVTGALPNVKK